MVDEPAPSRTAVVAPPQWVSPQVFVVPVLFLANATFASLVLKLPSDRFEIMWGTAIGGLLGEAGWLAAWGAIGPGRWWLRTVRLVVFGWLLCGAVVLFVPDAARGPRQAEQFAIMRLLPVWILCLQAPVSMAKKVLRLETLHDGRRIEPQGDLRQFGIRDVLIVTTIVAVCVASSGFAIIQLPLVAVPLQLLILPSIGAGLVAKNAATGALRLLGYFALLCGLLLLVLWFVMPRGNFAILARISICELAGFTSTTYGSILVARAAGFSLRRAAT